MLVIEPDMPGSSHRCADGIKCAPHIGSTLHPTDIGPVPEVRVGYRIETIVRNILSQQQ